MTDHDAESIRGACREAPFGKGDQTLVDTSVRKTWELDASHVQCTNPSWPNFFRTALDDVAAGLGLPNVHARPHKLLLYEKGSFFKRHKDSEKEVGMIATLVICLPAVHRGGAVHLSFGPEKREIATAPASPFDITALAWFSDVDHEVKPLNFGHRLVLTYKLFQSGGVKQSAKFLHEQSQKLKGVLGNWQTKFPEALMLAYPLEHQYTKSSLSLKNMKGRDRAVCNGLKEISAACGVFLVLAHMTRTEDEDYDGFYRSGDADANISADLDTIYSCEGVQIGSHHPVDESEILGSNDLEDRNPDSEDEGEFTGNESAPSSFRYHDTVAVLIPKHQIHQYLKTYVYSGLPNDEAQNLLSMIKQDFEDHPDDPVTKSSTLQFMTKLLDVCAASRSAPTTMPCTIAKWALEKKHESLYQRALKTALSYKEFPTELLEVISHFIDENFANNAEDVEWGKWLGPILYSTSLGGWSMTSKMFKAHLKNKTLQNSFSLWAQSQLDLKFDTQASYTVKDHDFFLDKLGQPGTSDKIASSFALLGTRELIFQVLDSIFRRRAQYKDDVVKGIFENTLEMASSRLVLQTKDFLEGSGWGAPLQDVTEFTILIEQSLAVGVAHQAIALVEECHKSLNGAKSSWNRSAISKNAVVRDLLVPLASTLHSHSIPPTPDVKGFFELLIRDVLHYKIPTYPQKLRGWRHKRRECFMDKNCADCAAMNAFLESEERRVWEFSAAEKRRKHVEARLSPTIFKTQTIRDRSPYTLVVEKRGTEHTEELKEFRQQLKDFESVLAPLKGDVFAAMLGDATYQELILLENMKPELASAPVPVSTAGTKRPSESDLAGDSSRQRR